MKKRNYIPKRPTFPRVRTNKSKRQPVYIEEKKPLGELCKENGIEVNRMAKLINLAFLLSDIMEGLVFDVEAELHKVDPVLSMELRHPISRIKIHAKEMVRFVDETYKNDDASYDFAEKADSLRELIEKHFK